MKALSIQQPWAFLIANGYKDIENRTWKTSYRGQFLIHASKKFDKEGYDWVKKNMPQVSLLNQNEFQRGGIVGVAVISDCVVQSNSPWFTGPVGFEIKEARTLPFTEMKGQLGFFTVNSQDHGTTDSTINL